MGTLARDGSTWSMHLRAGYLALRIILKEKCNPVSMCAPSRHLLVQSQQ